MDSPLSVLLAEKETKLVSVDIDATVLHCVQVMNNHKVGAVVILENQALKGVFTERDVLTKIIGAEKSPATTPVKEVMTANLCTVPPTLKVSEAMAVMTKNRFRHLPVVDDNGIIGMISIGDLTYWVSKHQEIQIKDLENYISGSW